MTQRKLLFVGIAIITLGVIGGAVWYVWSTQLKSADTTSNQEPSPTSDKVQFKTLTINGNTFRYPDDANNRQVIVEDFGSPTSPKIAYAPIRTYFAGNSNPDCMNASAGIMRADTLENFYRVSRAMGDDITIDDKKAELQKSVEAGRGVKRDSLYVLAPSKQNEPCTELTEAKDAKLKIALFEAQEIEKNWLKSLILVR